MNPSIPAGKIEQVIYLARGHRVMLDADLADLYGVETKALNRAVKRNLDRFPEDFMFQLADNEWENLKCQIGTSSSSYGGRRYSPYVFTQEGVAMLSGVLKSERAVKVNIEIMRAFVRYRGIMAAHQELIQRLDVLESRYDQQFAVVFDAIRQLMTPPDEAKGRIGFRVEPEEVPE